ncbi:MAG: hypothetical protein J0L82_13885 [Deltaproteobacteria bacterium]|nr:hypothetical protein [Deltaproteobacteria bacterium]
MKPSSKKFTAAIILATLGFLNPVVASYELGKDGLNTFPKFKEVSKTKECFREHLREAIAINMARRPFYARLSNFQSNEISDRLIAGEKLAKFASYLFHNFDAQAESYQEKGINIVCDEFVSMSLTPKFKAYGPLPHPDLRRFQELDPYILGRSLVRAIDEGYPQTVAAAKHWISMIKKSDARFNCMTRHLLESVGRIAKLAPSHIRKAAKRGVQSPAHLSDSMIAAHLLMLPESVALDTLAAPIQSQGIQILCQDVPPIHF